MLNLMVVSAGVSNPSSTGLLADRLTQALTEQAELNVERVNLIQWAHPLTDRALKGFGDPKLEEKLDKAKGSDLMVAVTPTFNGSFNGLFKNFFDSFRENDLKGMPVILGATGGSVRHSLMIEYSLRPLLTYLGAVPTPTGVFAAVEDFASKDLSYRITKAATELLELGGKERAKPQGEFEVESFSSMFESLKK